MVILKVIAGRARGLEDVAGILRRYPDVDAGYGRRGLEVIEEGAEDSLLTAFEASARS